MRKPLIRYFWNIEYVFAALFVLVMVRLLYVISENLPDVDDTSFLDPIFGRIDFLNIKDVSLDAIFAMKDTKFPGDKIAVVNVGKIGPTPDAKIALLLYKLKEWNAKAIGIDIIFDAQHFERFSPEEAFEVEAIKKALADVPNIVLPSAFDPESMKSTIFYDSSITHAVKNYGFINFTPDQDGVIRKFYPYRVVENTRRNYFPLEVLRLYDATLVEPLLRLPEQQQVIFYTGTKDQFNVYPIDDLLEPDERFKSNFKDAIVLIGFTDEAGLMWRGDLFTTPMRRKIVVGMQDGTRKVGLEGSDMSGLIVHANVLNMLLNQQYMRIAPEWVDWMITFFLSYGSIALYRVLRTKPRTKIGVGLMIGALIISETIVVFFLPIISFFYFNVKISYHLMATSVLLFIPAHAWITKLRHVILHRRVRAQSKTMPSNVLAPLRYAFRDDEPFPSYIGSTHASLFYLHYCFAIEAARKGKEVTSNDTAAYVFPLLLQWRAQLPALEKICYSLSQADQWQHYFYSFLEGKKLSFLRDSEMKALFLSTQYDQFNEHVYFEEWDILLPHIQRLFQDDLVDYRKYRLFEITKEQTNSPHVQSVGFMTSTQKIPPANIDTEASGLFLASHERPEELFPMAPFGEYVDCKLHRRKELFVYAGIIRKQEMFSAVPVYYGETVACEPVLTEQTMQWFRVHHLS